MEEFSNEKQLDRFDRKILLALQADGRLTNADLAKLVSVSPATCHRKTQRLVKEGFITGFRAMINPIAVNRGTLVMVGVVLDRSTQESFAAFEAAIQKLDFVLDCHLVAGDFDYLVKIRVRDMADFNKLHAEQLIGFPGIRQIRSFFVMKEVTDNAELEF